MIRKELLPLPDRTITIDVHYPPYYPWQTQDGGGRVERYIIEKDGSVSRINRGTGLPLPRPHLRAKTWSRHFRDAYLKELGTHPVDLY